MKMIFNLIRKDALLVRKYIYFLALVTLAAPSLLLLNMDVEAAQKDFYGGMLFFLLQFIIVLFLSNSVSLLDETYAKGCAYLCTTPYSRNQIVLSKYFFSYLTVAVYCIIYMISYWLLPKYTIEINWYFIVGSIVIISIFRGILIPLEFKFGYEKAKYIITFSIIATPFLISLLFGSIDISTIDFSFLDENKVLLSVGCLIAAVLFTIVSAILSCTIFGRKDL